MNKLIIAISFILVAQMMVPTRTSAMMHVDSSQVEGHSDTHESLDEVLPELLVKYNKNTIQELDCGSLTDGEFERVGDAVMESMHPGEAHERMDEMMGGEGSESLRQMHTQMGKRYFGCNSTDFAGGMGIPVLSGAKGMGMGSFGNMMDTKTLGHQWLLANNSRLGSLHVLLAVITWVAFIAFLIAGARWFWKKAGK